jgi:hypothetical protein
MVEIEDVDGKEEKKMGRLVSLCLQRAMSRVIQDSPAKSPFLQAMLNVELL